MVKIREEIGYIRQKSFRFFDSTILDAVSFKKYNKHNIWYIWEEQGSGALLKHGGRRRRGAGGERRGTWQTAKQPSASTPER